MIYLKKRKLILPGDGDFIPPGRCSLLGQRMMMAAGVITPATISNTENSFLAESARTVATFSTQAFGAADADRNIVVCHFNGNGSATVRTTDSMTIGGVAATKIVEIGQSGANSSNVALFIAAVPSGTTGDIVCTKNGSSTIDAIGVWRIIGSALTASDTASDANSDGSALALTIDCPAGGVIVGMSGGRGAGGAATTWANITEDFDTSGAGSSDIAGASDAFAATQTNLAITADPAGTGHTTDAAVVASFAAG